jgi:hypothetical protein
VSLPKLLNMAQVARMLSSDADPWDARKARRRLMASGALTKVGSRFYTSPAALMEAMGSVGVELFLGMGDDDAPSAPRGRR